MCKKCIESKWKVVSVSILYHVGISVFIFHKIRWKIRKKIVSSFLLTESKIWHLIPEISLILTYPIIFDEKNSKLTIKKLVVIGQKIGISC